jgi:hypothetical protein
MRLEALTVVSISVFWLVAQCNDIDRLPDSEEMLSPCSKQENWTSKMGA